MADFYTEMAAVATAMIAEFGRTITIAKSGQSTPVVSGKPWHSGYADADVTIPNVKAFFTTGDASDEHRNIGATLIREGKEGFLIDASSIGDEDLKTYERIIDGSETWTIERVERLKPGDTALLYGVEVRK